MAACTLKAIPEDVYRAILEEQQAIKKQKEVNVYSVEQTIIHMLKELIQLKKQTHGDIGNYHV